MKTIVSIKSSSGDEFFYKGFLNGNEPFSQDINQAEVYQDEDAAQRARESSWFLSRLSEFFRTASVSLVSVRIVVERIEDAISN